MPRSVTQDVADLVVWLDHDATMTVLRLLLRDERAAAFAHLRRIAPDLDEALAGDPAFYERLLDELEQRVSPDDEQDDLETREIPDLSRFAREQETEEKPRRR
jgi:hypothetical protein